MASTQRNDLLKALASVIANAPQDDRDTLAYCLAQYAYTFPQSYHDLTRHGENHRDSMVSALLNCIEEHSEAHIYYDNFGKANRS